MTANGILFLVLGAAVVLSPILTVFAPRVFGMIGIIALTCAGIYFAAAGKSAFTETTSAVFICGAFALAGLIAILNEIRRGNDLPGREE